MAHRTYEELLLPQFHRFIVASKSGRRLTKSKKKFSAGSIQQYRSVYQLLAQFEKKQEVPLLIRYSHKQNLSFIKADQKYWQRFQRAFSLFLMKEKGCFDAYVASVFKVLRTFFSYLKKEKHIPLSGFTHLLHASSPIYAPLVLEPSQLQFLIKDKRFEESLSIHLRRTKDIFVFGCTVALRYTDLMQLRKTSLVKSPTGNYLLVPTQKTGAIVKLPVPAYLLSIISKYNRHCTRYLLPRLSNVNFNLQVKRLMERAGWTYTLPKIRHQMGKAIELKRKNGQPLRFCDQVTAHTMRRTAITTLLMLGVPEQAVRRISGHAPGSKEFYRYVAVAEDYVFTHIENAFEKLMQAEMPLKMNDNFHQNS